MDEIEVFRVHEGDDEAFVMREIVHKKGPPTYGALVFGDLLGMVPGNSSVSYDQGRAEARD